MTTILATEGTDSGIKIGILYIRKSVFERGRAWPQELRVTIDVVEAPQ
jgi:hypothetical protein